MKRNPNGPLELLVQDAITLLGAQKVDTNNDDIRLWGIPGRPGAWNTGDLVLEAIRHVGRTSW